MARDIDHTGRPPGKGDRSVEASVKSIAAFLSGLAALIAGAFIRSCNDGIASDFAHAWCGVPPRVIPFSHQHCSGCVLMAAGVGLIAISPILLTWARLRNSRALR